MHKYFVIAAICAAAGLTGCVNPKVVSTQSASDSSLSCADIANQFTELNAIRKEAEAGRSVSGQNVAAAVIFWPAVVGNAMNSKQAIEAANEREKVLVGLAQKKRCRLASAPHV